MLSRWPPGRFDEDMNPENSGDESYTMQPIGFYYGRESYSYQAPRQATLAPEARGIVKLIPGRNYEQALRELDGFERIWLLYLFHHNRNWKPMVQPPRHSHHKVGVFASRAPYRPNPIGMSAVKLLKIKGLEIHVQGSDILNDTPILDIKPYLPYADSFSESRAGWTENASPEDYYRIRIAGLFGEKSDFIHRRTNLDPEDFARLQLEYRPLDPSRKRIRRTARGGILAHRTWRIDFSIDEEKKEVTLEDIHSGYSEEELADVNDPYQDKALHRDFKEEFYRE